MGYEPSVLISFDKFIFLFYIISVSLNLSNVLTVRGSANYSGLKSWTRPFSSKSPCRTDWVTREENKTWCWWTTMTTLHIITNHRSCLSPLSLSLSLTSDEDWRVINCVQPSLVWTDQLYCAKLLRLSDNLSWRGEGGEETPVSRGRIFMFNLNNWDLSWCVACARVRSWHFIIWISAQLDTINYPDLCHATKVHRLRFMITNLSVILKTTHWRLRTVNILRYHNITEQHEFLFWSILESEKNLDYY